MFFPTSPLTMMPFFTVLHIQQTQPSLLALVCADGKKQD
jgi:hypothetical protein